MIFDTNTVINPWAVMIKSFDTVIADSTMSASCTVNDLALWAKINWVDIS